MTPTLDDVEQLVGLPVDGNATVIGATWGFPAILELEKVLSDGTAATAKKKNGLTTRLVARAYMLYVLGYFLFPTKKGIDVSARYLYLFAKDKVAKKWLWGLAVLAHMYYNLGAASRDDWRKFVCCTTLLESLIFAHFLKLVGIPKEMDSNAYKHCTCWKWDASVTDRYGGTALLKFREALDNYKLENILECKILEAKNTSLKAELRQKSSLEDCNQSLSVELNKKLVVLQSHQPVPDATLAKKYDNLLAAYEDVKKKLIAKEDFASHLK
ncbi:hypothetical protein GIB67_022312 [Kingdonia uniflora]|uniref:Aminotransferase-like plant mobile domain-containing protein n=1 Tax=Kingdonia uniflora TaxID=39325 RepID=A0A7J7KW79_9MAGN|nr:hypothetical protein GIB67_022312 [Kingdonia uniflora]